MVKVLACSERIFEKVMGPPQRGLVHSAFSSAANLIFAQDFLLSLNASPLSIFPQHSFFQVDKVLLPLMPNGLLLSAHAGEWPFSSLKRDMPVVLGVGWLALDAISCSLVCQDCLRWNPRIARPTALDIDLLRDNARWLAWFCQRHRPWGAGESLEHEEGEPILDLAARICGRGHGLTPGGDDFLAGWMAVGWLIYGSQPAFLEICQRISALANRRTHALSQCWLAYAAAGDVASPVRALLIALTDRDQEGLEHATRNALALGATSGYDLLQGVLYGIGQFPLF